MLQSISFKEATDEGTYETMKTDFNDSVACMYYSDYQYWDLRPMSIADNAGYYVATDGD